MRLGAAERYVYSIKRIVDWEAAWGLWDNGWALFGDGEGREAVPIWPARQFASLCVMDDWASFDTKEVPLDEFIVLLRDFREDGLFVSILPTPPARGAFVSPNDVIESLQKESEHYQ